MRIRQHARFSVAPNSPSSSTPSTEVCVLNRSPWDVLSDRPQSELEYQVKIVDNLSYNGGGGESTGYAPDSVVALKKQSSEEVVKTREKEVEQEEDRKLSLVDIVKEKRNKKSKKVKRKVDYIQCSRSDGKRWHCKNEAIEGHTLCEHHLTQLKSYSINHSRCPPRKAQKAKAASAAPADYIYYSGFGPWWGRKRGQQKIQKDELEVVDAVNQAIASAVADYFTSDDEENSEGENNKGKRTRKPVKTRLLTSLL